MANDRWEDENSQDGAGLWQNLRGVPSDPLMNKGELLLSQQRDILDALRGGLPTREPGSSLDIPRVEVMPPEVHTDVHINIPDMAETLRPQFDELIGTQQEVARTTKGLGYLGQMALQESRMQSGLLDEIGQTGRKAIEQRDMALTKLTQAAGSLSRIDRGIKGMNEGMQSIDRGVQGTNDRLEILNDNMGALLGDIGQGIGGMTNEMVTTRLEILEMLKKMQGVFLWGHREQMWWLKSIYDALIKPRKTGAREAWEIGEKCRRRGDVREAVRYYKEGLHENHSEPRIHFSLGLMELSVGRAGNSYQHFDSAAEYALLDQDRPLAAYALMHEGKVYMFENNLPVASKCFQQALKLDANNLECWFELAVCECKQGNYQDAAKVLEVLIKRSRKYAMKAILEPAFFPLHEWLNQLMKKVLGR